METTTQSENNSSTSAVATRYEVIDSRTQIVVGSYSNRRRAHNAADRMDNVYGAVRYFVRRAA